MSYVRRVAVLAAAGVVGALLGASPVAAAPGDPAPPPRGPVSAPPARPADPGPPEWVGTYQLVAKDVVRPDGSLRDVYDHRLVVGDRSYKLRLPKGTRLTGGTPVRVRGTLANADLTADEVTAVGAPAQVATTGTTKVLVILAYWSAPDSMTVAKARNQVFSDDHGWFGEASYGQLGLTGDVTGWHKITAPTSGRCYDEHQQIMDRAKSRAAAAGFDATRYQRTMVYFPQCSGDAAGVAGWAYQPGNTVWLNGYFDRRVSVHEQGHNYGLPHAHTLRCTTSGGATVTLGGTCGHDEYGDDYDAMGGSPHAAHFSGPQKDRAGWLGTARKRVLGAGPTTFTLPAFEKDAATPLVAVASTPVPSRKYWIEHRRAVGYDNTLPPGATDGVLVRLVDAAVAGGGGPFLLDPSPQTGFDDAVIPPGGAWTSPEGVRISVGAVTGAGATVTVAGGADPPTKPTAPRNVSATGGDGAVRLAWDPPASNGGDTVQSYVVTRTPGGVSTVVTGATTATLGGLANGTTYSFTVAARNSAGTSVPSDPVTATPAAQLPDVVLTSPAAGATLTGTSATLTATATPNPGSAAPIEFVTFEVDGENVGYDDTAPYTADLDPSWLTDGAHTVTATAYDTAWRYKTSAPVEVQVVTPRPAIAIETPAGGAVVTIDQVEVTATSTPVPGTEILWVTYELTDGTVVGYGDSAAPHTMLWDTSGLHGEYQLFATAYDEMGRSGRSAPVDVTIQHPVPSVVLTAPAEAAAVEATVTLAADATPNPESQAPISYVEFRVGDAVVDIDYEAPYSYDWDSSALSGEHVVAATAYDTAGRRATSPGRTIFLDNPLPTVAVTAPAAGAVVSDTVTFTAAAEANPEGAPIARVEFLLDGWLPLGPVEAPGPYTVPWDSTGAYGAHTVQATAYDTAGRSARSAVVAFTVASPAPSAVFTAPAPGATLRSGVTELAVAAAPDPKTGTPIWYVEFAVDGVPVGMDDEASDGFSVNWELLPGEHVLTARAYDGDGYSGDAAPVTVMVADPPGVPTGVAATAGQDGTATVSWTAPASNGGSPLLGYVVRGSDGAERAAAGSPFTVTGLANGTSYTFQVQATNLAGAGELSAASNAVRPGTATALTAAVSATRVSYGRTVTTTGTLTGGGAPLAGRRVELRACAPGSATACTTVKTGTTSDTGKVSIAYAPKLHRDLRLRYVATGDRYLAVTSAARRVSVAAVVTSAVSRTTLVLGRSFTVSGRVAPVHSGKRVYLQRYTSTGWKSVAYKNQSSTGYVAWTVKPAAKGTYRYRLHFAGDADHLAGTSPTRTVTVTAA